MTDESITFRVAVSDDWAGIWPVFRAVVSTGDTYSFPPDIDESDARAAWLFDGSGRRATYVALLGDTVVGTAYIKPNQPGLGDHVANAGWMIDPSMAGRGLGRRFAEYVIDDAVSRGFTGMQFNAVVATNTRAIALWESFGFSIVGTIPDAFRHAELGPTDVHIMYRRLV